MKTTMMVISLLTLLFLFLGKNNDLYKIYKKFKQIPIALSVGILVSTFMQYCIKNNDDKN